MKLTREVKISDDNYGNSTSRVEVELTRPQDAADAHALLDEYEAILRSRSVLDVEEESLTVREARERNTARQRINSILADLAQFELAPELRSEGPF